MTARAEILSRILRARPAFEPDGVARSYRQKGVAVDGPELVVPRFVDRLLDYGAEVTRCDAETVRASIDATFERHGVHQVLVPQGFPEQWLPRRIPVERDLPHRSAAELDAVDAVLTTCALAIAETGTLMLDGGPGMGRRALTLVPDLHVVVIPATAIVHGLPEAVALVEPRRPLTWISGPSATSDIELDRIVGVHGPRRLAVVVVD